MSPQFTSYHQLLQRNPNVNFKLENSKANLVHKSSVDPSITGNSFGRYLTVKANNNIQKMKTVDEENLEESDKNISINNNVILLRPIT